MMRLIPEKLHVKYLPGASPEAPVTPRYYKLTNSDFTGDLFLSIGHCYDTEKTSKLYTRLMRDEVLAELKKDTNDMALNVHCHVSARVEALFSEGPNGGTTSSRALSSLFPVCTTSRLMRNSMSYSLPTMQSTFWETLTNGSRHSRQWLSTWTKTGSSSLTSTPQKCWGTHFVGGTNTRSWPYSRALSSLHSSEANPVRIRYIDAYSYPSLFEPVRFPSTCGCSSFGFSSIFHGPSQFLSRRCWFPPRKGLR